MLSVVSLEIQKMNILLSVGQLGPLSRIQTAVTALQKLPVQTIEAPPITDSRASECGSEDTNQVVNITAKPPNSSETTIAVDLAPKFGDLSNLNRSSQGGQAHIHESMPVISANAHHVFFCAAGLWEDDVSH